jgi:hypothetical protein
MAYGILFTWRHTNFFHSHKQYSNLAYGVSGQILGEDCSHNRGEENYEWQGRIVSTRKKNYPITASYIMSVRTTLELNPNIVSFPENNKCVT